jgi:type II secretory pathway component PulF
MLSKLHDLIFKVTLLDKMLFTKHLSLMLKSGIPLTEAIEAIKDQTKNPTFKVILGKIIKDIENGQSLEKALGKYPEVFDSLYLSLIEVGEKSGNLEENLDFLATQLKKIYDFNKKVSGAMLYPKLVLAAATIMGGAMSLFVLPQLFDLFTSLDVELPLSTKILLFFSGLMKDYGIFIIGGLAIIWVGFMLLIRTSVVKPKWQRFILTIPRIGELNQNIALTSICRNMGIMLKSGLTITTALETESKATENLVFKDYLSTLKKSIEKGKKLSEEMQSQKFAFVPAIVPKMVGVGENTGNLDEIFIYLGDFFEQEVDDTTKNLANVIEPVLLLVIGVLVAFMALAIISPIYQLTGGIRK